ncbi:gliding motility-associated protein GldC [Chitinophaga terrae (ex Kim and Jung 2007)]|jgi:gliding motility-associated protein GldC|uniref:Gliding motility-associated protein GldC n=1 Tax=Chitinophaga terrae (ex Kim and Jung 2007) TaxID=408074 RepID=A0A1H3XW81_9BACT|nr:gliding motility protein GldC [Chitinophaga terrae (ex Kim and Jung 2007)]MDQ0105729.1 gliding motility-associated protein GldC [Chitinophaga terrae (ex Kim and Jung 2007)]GEP89402.1 gliding motility protein GldC [Chitinophaga terrae (ex Kim and Jung 2007)]SEA03111.1 gliding motility-associated protein GldC [Chitinophaga terrae (ex Kim and Jung 2007)]
MSTTSTIKIQVGLDDQKIPESIEWSATDNKEERMIKAKGMIVSFWDPAERAALRIDLWTKDMMVDEMADFFFQTMMTMADTYARATPYKDQAQELKDFAKDFFRKFQEKQKAEGQ